MTVWRWAAGPGLLLLTACPQPLAFSEDAGSVDAGARCMAAAAAEPVGLFFRETTSSALGTVRTEGFGRPTVVDLDGDGHDDLVATPAHDGLHAQPPWAYTWIALRSKGDGTFEDFTARSGLGDAHVGLLLFGDLDNDGDQDAYGGVIATELVTGTQTPNPWVQQEGWGVWRNDGRGHFTHEGANGTVLRERTQGGVRFVGPELTGALIDFDRDGALDLYLGTWQWTDLKTTLRYTPPPRDLLFRGKGDGTFEDVSAALPDQNPRASGIGTAPSRATGRSTMGVAPGDYDNDGDMDLFVANYGAGRPVGPNASRPLCTPPMYWDQNLLWRNDGSLGSFVEWSAQAGVSATSRGPNGILNEPVLTLGTECPVEMRGTYPGPIGGNHFTPQFGDFDNDGDLDLLVGAISHPDFLQLDPTSLFVNQGAPTYSFTEEAAARGLVWREDEKQVFWVDVDADGWLDIATTGYRSDNEFRVYRQDPATHRFVKVETAVHGVSDRNQEGAAWLDVDDDGDLDLYVANDAEFSTWPTKTGEAGGRVYRNEVAGRNHRLALQLVASKPRDATGARVLITTSSAGTQLREITGPSGHYNAAPSRTVFFGLGGDSCASEVTVRWPDGTVESLGALAGDARYRVEQGRPPVKQADFPPPAARAE